MATLASTLQPTFGANSTAKSLGGGRITPQLRLCNLGSREAACISLFF
jgi:hypothetical protein